MTVRALYDVAAPAKLNLFLHVVGRRPDGYHLLESLFVLIDWCDTLHFELRSDARLVRHDLASALPDDDLCLRAARALQSASGTALGADILIDKRLPSGAGMGGGSSDAASVLLALNRLWKLGWSDRQLLALGLSLGADVPFFIGGHNALVEGIGERIQMVDVQPQWLAVVKPPASLETAAVFKHPSLMVRCATARIESLIENAGCGVEAGENDLQPAAEAICTEVTEAASLLDRRFGNSRMTGSGSAVFARAGRVEAECCQGRPTMPELPGPGWIGRMCRSLPVHPLAGWATG